MSGTEKKIMALDYGARTVGVAITDSLIMTAQPAETIRRDSENKLRRTLARIRELAKENDVGLIVVGLPLNMDDSVGERAEKALAFAEMVRNRTGLPVEMQDERLSTVAAQEVLDEMGVHGREQKQYVDKIAAAYIRNNSDCKIAFTKNFV